MRDLIIYNVEVWARNLFSIYFIDVFSHKTYLCYQFNESITGEEYLLTMAEKGYLIGCNNSIYDDFIYNYIIDHGEVDTEEIFNLSTQLIRHDKDNIPLYKNEDLWWYGNLYLASYDIRPYMEDDILRDDHEKIVFSSRYARVKHPDFKYGRRVDTNLLPTILDYNINNTFAILRLFNRIKSSNKLKYKIDGWSFKKEPA